MVALDITVDSLSSLKAIQRGVSAVDVGLLGVFMETNAKRIIRMRIKNRFASEGDAASGPWIGLSDATKSFRAASGFTPDHPINRRTGALYKWLMQMNPEIRILPYGGVEAKWPPALPDDKWLRQKYVTAQKGRPAANTPPRPVLAIDLTDLALIQGELAAFIGTRMGVRFT